jgi:hypothetical protein
MTSHLDGARALTAACMGPAKPHVVIHTPASESAWAQAAPALVDALGAVLAHLPCGAAALQHLQPRTAVALAMQGGAWPPPAAAAAWLQALGPDAEALPAAPLLYWAACAVGAEGPPPPAANAGPITFHTLFQTTAPTTAAGGRAGAPGLAAEATAANKAPPVICEAAYDAMAAAVRQHVLVGAAHSPEVVDHATRVLVAIAALAALAAAIPSCAGRAPRPFTPADVAAAARAVGPCPPTPTEGLPGALRCFLRDHAAQGDVPGTEATHCAVVRLQVSALQALVDCLEGSPAFTGNTVGAALHEHAVAACRQPLHSTVAHGDVTALPAPEDQAVTGVVPAAAVVHDLFFAGAWQDLTPSSREALQAAAAGGHPGVLAAVQAAGKAPTPPGLPMLQLAALHALMDVRAGFEYETLVPGKWGGCPRP